MPVRKTIRIFTAQKRMFRGVHHPARHRNWMKMVPETTDASDPIRCEHHGAIERHDPAGVGKPTEPDTVDGRVRVGVGTGPLHHVEDGAFIVAKTCPAGFERRQGE